MDDLVTEPAPHRALKPNSDKVYQDTTVKFLVASLKGWAFCRDNADGSTVSTKQPEGKAYPNEFVQKAADLLKSQGSTSPRQTFEPATITLHPAGGAWAFMTRGTGRSVDGGTPVRVASPRRPVHAHRCSGRVVPPDP